MNQPEILKHLEEWALHIKATSAQIEALHAAVGTCDGPLIEAIWRLQDAYTDAVSALVGDQCEWLNYFRNECAMGAKPQYVCIKVGAKSFAVKSLKKLSEIIASEAKT